VSFKNLYEILLIENFSNIDEVKKAFRLLAKSKHPDLNIKTSVQSFIEINEAYKVLSQPESKEIYDEQLKSQLSSPRRSTTISRIDKEWIKQYKSDQERKRNTMHKNNEEALEVNSRIKFKRHLWMMLLAIVLTFILMWIIAM
jgi:DnaJ-class molecular chaperone